uniref:glucan endo-1,3-beta-D-glucosidase n=1 Tax=Ananas comosus var. bracteatus TaxID=296719 RepID=A0A6V7QZ38_ANACO
MLKELGKRLSSIKAHIIFKNPIAKEKKRRRSRSRRRRRRQQQTETQIPIQTTSSSARPPPSIPPIPASISSTTMTHRHDGHKPFLFPGIQSTVLPDPSPLFSPQLLSSPLPTNSFFQNFALKNGDQPEYIHPYLIKSSSSSLSLSFPPASPPLPSSTKPSSPTSPSPPPPPRTLTLNPTSSPPSTTSASPSTSSPPPSAASSSAGALRHRLHPRLLPRGPLHRHHPRLPLRRPQRLLHQAQVRAQQRPDLPLLLLRPAPPRPLRGLPPHRPAFSGVVRLAFLPDPSYEPVLDRFSSCYPVSGAASLARPFCVEYNWAKEGWGELLLLAHPLHLRLLDRACGVTVLEDFKYRSIDGDLVGVVADSWVLRTDPVSPTWHSMKGVSEDGFAEIASALCKDADGLCSAPIATTSSYFYGKAVARAARLALIAEEVGFPDVIPAVRQFLKASVTPWLDGSFGGNAFLYDHKWGGLVTKQGSVDSGADFGFGIFNDHHYHLGYFIYAIAVLSKLDPSWGRKYMSHAYSMVADFMTLSRKQDASYARLRCFDLWKLHSWAGGLTEFADGRNQESMSEAVNAYYSAALLGLSFGDTHLVAIGSTLAAFEILAAQTWWHVREGEGMYEDDFSRENRVVGVLWANKRDSGLWFAPPSGRNAGWVFRSYRCCRLLRFCSKTSRS